MACPLISSPAPSMHLIIKKLTFFPILFFKRICDVYDEEFADAMEQVNDEELAKSSMFHRINIPDNCHWREVFSVSHDIGQILKEAFSWYRA